MNSKIKHYQYKSITELKIFLYCLRSVKGSDVQLISFHYNLILHPILELNLNKLSDYSRKVDVS